MQRFGSDPQLIGINSNLHSLLTRMESLERSVSQNQVLIMNLTEKIDAQAQMLQSMRQGSASEKSADTPE